MMTETYALCILFSYRQANISGHQEVFHLAVRLPQRLLRYGLISCAYYFLRVYLFFLRIGVIGEDMALQYVADDGRVIIALWHQRFLPALAYASRLRKFKPCVMISQSEDGDLIAPLAKRLGIEPVRGSSSKGGKKALATILKALNKNPVAVHIVDGPKGPKGVVKPGLIKMAQISGATIIPFFASTEKAWAIKSWDRFLIPKPFSKVMLRWGEPFFVPRHVDAEAFETLRKDIEDKLAEGYAEDDLGWGWKEPL